jgi:hypothetical protein
VPVLILFQTHPAHITHATVFHWKNYAALMPT